MSGFLGSYTAGEAVHYSEVFRDPITGDRTDPDLQSLLAFIQDTSGEVTNLPQPAKIHSTVGWFGGSFDSTNMIPGTYQILMQDDGLNESFMFSFEVRPAVGQLNSLAVEVLDENSVPLAIALTEIRSNGILIATANTDILGTAYFGALPEGDYTVRAFSSGYSIPETAVTILAGDNTLSIEATAVDPVVPPANPEMCTIYGYTSDIVGSALVGSEVIISAGDDEAQFQSGRAISRVPTKVYTDPDGYFEVDILKNVEVRIRCNDVNYARVTTLTSDTKDWKDIDG